jgi:hypothetical protein
MVMVKSEESKASYTNFRVVWYIDLWPPILMHTLVKI